MPNRKRHPVGPRVLPDDADLATATREAAVRHRDVVARLRRDRRLGAEHVRAAREIRLVWQAFGRGLFPAVHSAPTDGERALSILHDDPVGRMSLAEEAAWRTRYRPWASEMSHEIVAATARLSRLQLVLDIVVDHVPVAAVEDGYRLRPGRALQYLSGALDRYSEIAGWPAPGAPR